MSDGRVVFEIDADASKLRSALSQATADIKTETDKWSGSVGTTSEAMSTNLIDAFKAVVSSSYFAKISKMLLDLGIESINLASDLEEVQNVVDVTFGEEGSKRIEAWSKTVGKNFGLTELQAKQYSGYIGAMLTSSGVDTSEVADMAMELTEIAADLASFYNLPFDEAFNKVYAGLSGLTRPLRSLGIDLSVAAMEEAAMEAEMGESYSKMSLAEKMMMRYREIVAKTALAQGDFVRTNDSYANSMKRIEMGATTLKAQLGELLLPIAKEVTNAVATLLEVLTYEPPETAFDTAAEAMGDAVEQSTKAEGILGYMEKLYARYGDAAQKTEEWQLALAELRTVMPEVNEYINQETGALELNNEQLMEYIANMKQAAIEDAKKAAIQQLTNEYVDTQKAYFTAEVNRDIANEQANAAAENLIEFIATRLPKIAEENPDIPLRSREELLNDFYSGGTPFENLVRMASGVVAYTGEGYDAIEKYNQIYEEQTKAAGDASREMENLQSKIASLEYDLSIAEEALNRLAAAAVAAESALSTQKSSTDGILSGLGSFFGERSFAQGLDRVPYDNFVASLHEGETVLTAEEAKLWRQIKYGNHNANASFDYDALGGVLRDNVHAGGNVYLDGRTVGQVISGIQGQSYRTLQRSGWQS